MDNKERIILSITQRIKEEQKKHESNIPNWHEIAARKIYASFDITLKQENTFNDFLSLIEEYREKELPNRNQPYHYEAEISSGLNGLLNFIKNKQEDNIENGQ